MCTAKTFSSSTYSCGLAKALFLKSAYMSAREVLNLVLSIFFTSFLNLIKGDA